MLFAIWRASWHAGSTHFRPTEVVTDRDLHLILCNLDLLADKPESRYVLGRTIDYLVTGQASALAKRCVTADLEHMLQ